MLADNVAVGRPVDLTPNRWTSCLNSISQRRVLSGPCLLGILPGEGIGPEVIRCTLQVLNAIASNGSHEFVIEYGGPIGRDSERVHGDGEALSGEVVEFCEDVFARGGAILNGPGGGRYVYDLRRKFDLFFKISPLQADKALMEASQFKPGAIRHLDILVTRENTGGIYQGNWEHCTSEKSVATHSFEYSPDQVARFLNASARLAASRRGRMTVVWKESGVPAISQLWRDCAEWAAAEHAVEFKMVDVDLMAYRLIQEPAEFDVIATPNLFGDVLGDLGAVLLGSRGTSFSGNYNAAGHAVYQTNHGAAYDLAGTDRANPVGQIFSLAMMLRETFGMFWEARAVEEAVRQVWHQGWRTEDVATPGACIVGTKDMGELIAGQAAQRVTKRLAA